MKMRILEHRMCVLTSEENESRDHVSRDEHGDRELFQDGRSGSKGKK
jgi:hypothetical protein